MSFNLDSIQSGSEIRAPLIVIHGAPEAGKTTFAAKSFNPVFIRVEDGLGLNNVPTFPLVKTYDDVMSAIASLYQPHNFNTVVIDSASALEPLIWAKTCQDYGKGKKRSIEDFGFGKGYVLAMRYWEELVKALWGLAHRGVTPIIIAHSDIVRFDPPDSPAYDRYQIKLQKRAYALLYEQADIIGFANKPVYVTKADADDHHGKAVGKGIRQLTLTASPAVVAKNRFAMPDTVPLDWMEFAKHVPFYTQNH